MDTGKKPLIITPFNTLDFYIVPDHEPGLYKNSQQVVLRTGLAFDWSYFIVHIEHVFHKCSFEPR